MLKNIFAAKYKGLGMSAKAITKSIELIKTKYDIDEISLSNSHFYRTSSILIIHNENDKEIPFAEFSDLKNICKNATFHATKGLGYRV